MSTHRLTAETQGKFHYTVGPYFKPVLRVRPGETIAVDGVVGTFLKQSAAVPVCISEVPVQEVCII